MAKTELNMQLLLRRDEVFTSTYVLEAGEPGFEISTNTLKVGNGTNTWAELAIANKTEIDALIKVTDDKVAALTETVGKLNETYATDDEVEAIRAALAEAKLDKSVYEAYIATHAMTDTEITEAIGAVDGKFASYRTAADQDAIDATKVDAVEGKSLVADTEIAKLATVAEGATKTEASATNGNIKINGVETVVYTHPDKHTIADVTGLQDALDAKAAKDVVDAMYTNTQIDDLIQGAKDYADANDADTKYGITYDSVAKKIKLVEGGSEVEIDASAFIKDGMINSVTIDENDDLIITFNTDAGKENIVLPLDQLVDIYTGSTGARVTVTVASDKSISAELVAGSISKNYLDADVQASLAKADSAVQDVSTLATKAELEAVDKKFENYTTTSDMTAAIGAAEQAAKDYADANDADTTYTVAPTANPLEFTVTPSEGEAQTIQLVAPTVDVGVTQVVAGDDITVTPEAGTGVVTVAHAEFTTGEYTKDPATSDRDNDVYMMTSVAVQNGHVTGANVKSLAHALEAMTFVLDGGNSTT